MTRWWPQFRAAFLAFHLAAITLAACPNPSGHLAESSRIEPEMRQSMSTWTGLLARLGLAADEDEALALLFGTGRRYARSRAALVKPLQPYLNLTGTRQSWGMFSRVKPKRSRLEVHGLAEGRPPQPLYVECTSARWNHRLLDQSRVRAMRHVFAARKMNNRYQRFATRLGREALAAHPGFEAVQIQYRDVRIPPPAILRAQGSLTLGETRWSTTVRRDGA